MKFLQVAVYLQNIVLCMRYSSCYYTGQWYSIRWTLEVHNFFSPRWIRVDFYICVLHISPYQKNHNLAFYKFCPGSTYIWSTTSGTGQFGPDSSDPRHFGTTLVGPKCPTLIDGAIQQAVTSEQSDCGWSLMCNKNNIGPRTLPCGTPDSSCGYLCQWHAINHHILTTILQIAWQPVMDIAINSIVMELPEKSFVGVVIITESCRKLPKSTEGYQNLTD